ncbi:MAG: glycosyltransferase family 2 protein [Verrucomicrobiia bacterium]
MPEASSRSTPPAGVSVVITAYNYAHFLPQAIDSVLDQIYPNVEIVVIDDGSTDDTRELAEVYGDKIRYIYQDNSGLSAARNTGTREASHPYVAYLDADDEWHPTMLSALMTVFRHLPEDFGLVACGCDKMNIDGEIINQKFLEDISPAIITRQDIIHKNRFVADAVIARRDIVLKAGLFDETLTSSEDRDMWIRMASHARVYLLPEKLVKVRVHSASMSTVATRMKTNMLKVLAKARSEDSAARRKSINWTKAHSFLFFQTACMYHNKGATFSALRDLIHSAVLWPFFLKPHRLNENYLFRSRSLIRFLLSGIFRRRNEASPESGLEVFVSPLASAATDAFAAVHNPKSSRQSDGIEFPGVSVVIPAYNYAHYLPLAIDSVLQQNYPTFEIIIVDDGSTDNTPQVTEAYGDRIRVIRKENAGLSAARNTGIKAARYPYVAFLDADDEWMPGLLASMVWHFLKAPEPLDIVACQHLPVDQSGQLLRCKHLIKILPREIEFEDILLKSRFSPSAAIIRRDAFDECGDFDESLRSSEDRDMWLRIAARRRILLLRDMLVLVRNHPDSMSKHTDRMKANMRVVLNKAFNSGAIKQCPPFYRLKVTAFFRFQVAWMYFDEQRRWKALKEMTASLLLWPIFINTDSFNEPALFRVRSLVRFLFVGRIEREIEYRRTAA